MIKIYVVAQFVQYMCVMKTRTNVSIHPELLAKAQVLMEARNFSSFSELVESLIRDSWEEKNQNLIKGIMEYGRGNVEISPKSSPAQVHSVATQKPRRKPSGQMTNPGLDPM